MCWHWIWSHIHLILSNLCTSLCVGCHCLVNFFLHYMTFVVTVYSKSRVNITSPRCCSILINFTKKTLTVQHNLINFDSFSISQRPLRTRKVCFSQSQFFLHFHHNQILIHFLIGKTLDGGGFARAPKVIIIAAAAVEAMCMRAWSRVCVCVRERERERER